MKAGGTIMVDREKVIKGLTLCNCLSDLCYEHDCPYYNGVQEICGAIEDVGYSSDDCKEKLHTDAIALLKEEKKQKFLLNADGTITPLPIIVQCKYCWKREFDNCPFNENLGYKPEDDFFCADGERKEGR
jgi:hypothetical protein